jgi:hypothetical protein
MLKIDIPSFLTILIGACFVIIPGCDYQETMDDSTDTETETGLECDGDEHHLHINQEMISLNFETNEEKIIPIPITGPADDILDFYGDALYPFEAEIIDFQFPDEIDSENFPGKALRIIAPEFPLMPESDYLTSMSRNADFWNSCNSVGIVFEFNMLFGCSPIDTKVTTIAESVKAVTVIGSRYKQDTGVVITNGQNIHFYASGEICWNKFDADSCKGVEQVIGVTWGVWVKIGNDYYPLESDITIEHNGQDGDLSFIVPDGWRPDEIIVEGDEQHCVDDYYKDSGGEGIYIDFYTT